MKSIYTQTFTTYPFTGIWQRAFGKPETGGAWLIWGMEKNGKTWFTLMLSNYLSKFSDVLYISAEEGLGENFVSSCKRAGIADNNKKMRAVGYVPLEELETRLKKRRPPKVVVIDNLTIYNDEMKHGRFRRLLDTNLSTLFIFIAHEENKQPYTGTAKMARKLAKIIVHVEGLAANISGRCPGGVISIHKEKAQLYWGTETENNNSDE